VHTRFEDGWEEDAFFSSFRLMPVSCQRLLAQQTHLKKDVSSRGHVLTHQRCGALAAASMGNML